MQPEKKNFFARGGTLLVAGIALALVSVVFSLIPIMGGPDPFTLIAGSKATFQLQEMGAVLALGYLFVVIVLTATGLFRLIESAHGGAREADETKRPDGGTGMHPAT